MALMMMSGSAYVCLAALVSNTMYPGLDIEPCNRLLDHAIHHPDALTIRVLKAPSNDLLLGVPMVYSLAGSAVLTVEECRRRIEVSDQVACLARRSLRLLAKLTAKDAAGITTTGQAAGLARSLGRADDD